MGKRIAAIMMTVLSYVLIYSGIRYLIKRFMGEDAPYGRFAATLGTLALSPRFSYHNEDGEKRMEARWLLFKKRKKVFAFGARKESREEDSTEGSVSGQHPEEEQEVNSQETPVSNSGENGSAP